MPKPVTLMRVLVVCGLLNLNSASPVAPSLHKQARRIMGTYCEVQVYDSNAARADRAIAAALDEMQRVDLLLSNYNAASELSKINREASLGPVRASPELYGFFKLCRALHDETMGTFDPTVGPIVRAWGFFTPHPTKPSDADIDDAKSRSGFDKVWLNDEGNTIFYTVAGLEMDPGGIGKGYAVDKAVEILKKRGVRSALVSAGGSTLYAIGRPPGRDAWRVAIKNPLNAETPFAIALLRDDSLSTSGISEQSVRLDGHRYSHIFDPRTGDPVEQVCQVSVIAETATDSDALTKAAFVLPQDSITQLFQKRRATHALKVQGECAPSSSAWITPWSSSVFLR